MATDSIFAKIRLVTLGNIHQLLNKMVDLNNIAAVEQHLRDLRNSLDGLENDAAQAEGQKRYVAKRLAGKQGEVAGLLTSIRTIQGDANPDNDHLAKAMAVKAVGLNKEIEALKVEDEDAKATDLAMDKAVSLLTASVTSFDSQLNRLRSLAESTKNKTRAAEALNAVAAVTANGDGLQLDNVSARIQKAAETADADVLLAQLAAEGK
jgi:phage shock protein A